MNRGASPTVLISSATRAADFGWRADAMDQQRLGERGEDRHARIQRRVRILKNHLHVPARLVTSAAVPWVEIFSFEHHGASGRRHELHDRCGARVDLPQPDSPTSPSTSPRRRRA